MTSQIQSLDSQFNRKIIDLEGLDGTGKSALAKTLLEILGDKAALMHAPPPKNVSLNDTDIKKYFKQANLELTEKIQNDKHEYVILDRSWLSGAATRFAKEKGPLKKWPSKYYRPTHLFLLTLPENIRLGYMENRSKHKPFTPEEIILKNNDQYRQDYLYALEEGAKLLRFTTIFRILDGTQLSIQGMALKIVSLLDRNLDLLDPRKLTIGNKYSIREIYESWQQRLKESTVTGKDFVKITSNASSAPVFDNEFREKHQCHFDNIGLKFDYAKFAETRHPPVSIGFLCDTFTFDEPIAAGTDQAQDMPIAFPVSDRNDYEYRLPSCYKLLNEFVQKVADVWSSLEPNAHEYYAYLSLSYGVIPPWKVQRRPGIHCDGFQSARVNPKEKGEYTFVASNSLPTLFYVEEFDTSPLDPSRDNFFIRFSQNATKDPIDCQRPYEIMMMDPYCLHSAVSNVTDDAIRRTFVRIIYSTRVYDRLGNTVNPSFDYRWEMVRREAQADLVS